MPESNDLRETLLNLGRGFEVSQCIFVAAELKLADLLAEHPQQCDTLAKMTETDRDALYRLLRVLEGINLVTEVAPHQFALTPLGQYLRSDVSGSIRNYLLMRAEQGYLTWGQLLYSLRHGKSAFEQVFSMNRYQYFKQNPAAGARFDSAMTELATQQIKLIANAYDFSTTKKLVDVGGGEGHLLITLLLQYPHLQGILFEQQQTTLEQGRIAMESAGVIERCQLISGDFFVNVPAGADVYLLKHILHNWNDPQALQILQSCAQAMPENARLLIIERIFTQNAPLKPRLVDLRMLVELSVGRMRTEEDFRSLLKSAGFNLTRIISTKSEFSILEAQPSKATT